MKPKSQISKSRPSSASRRRIPFVLTGSIAMIATAGISQAANGTWNVDANGVWSEPTNWLADTPADGIDAVANFNTVNITDERTVSLDSARTVGSLIFGDATTASNGWILNNNATPANILTLEVTTAPATPPTITVNTLSAGKEANISLVLAGTQGFNKAGVGTLVLSGNNSITGPVSVLASNGGVLRLDSGGVLNATALDIVSPATNSNINQLTVNGGTLTASGLTTLRAGSATRNSVIVINSGTADFNGGLEGSNAGGPALFQVNGGTVSMASYMGYRSANAADDFTKGFIAAGGTTTITGNATVANGSNFGAMSIEGGTVAVGGSLTVFGPVQSNTRTVSLRVTGGGLSVADGTNGLVLLTKSNVGNFVNVTFSGGTSTIEKITMAAAGSNNGTMNLTLSGGNLYLGSGGLTTVATTSTKNITLQTGTLGAKANWSSTLAMVTSASASDTVTIKAADEANAPFNIALNGAITGAGKILKTGGGTLTLGGNNSLLTGAVQVDAGTLLVNGTTNGVTLAAGTMLGGSGTVGGPVGMVTGTTLAPGSTTTIGTLNTTDTVTFVSSATFDADINSNPSPSSDLLNVTGDLNLAGASLAVQNLGAAVPPSFTVFTIATYTGTLTGTFNGLAEGATVPIGGLDYILKYADGGNNITLTAPLKIATPYDDWAEANITNIDPLADATPEGDPDHDGASNLEEFAFNGIPLNGADNGQVYMLTADSDYVGDPSGASELILTVAVRSGTPTFAGTPSPTAIQVADGITYTIQGSTTLDSFNTVVNVVPTPVITDLPPVGSGYEYRSFSLDGSNGLPGKGFLRAKASN